MTVWRLQDCKYRSGWELTRLLHSCINNPNIVCPHQKGCQLGCPHKTALRRIWGGGNNLPKIYARCKHPICFKTPCQTLFCSSAHIMAPGGLQTLWRGSFLQSTTKPQAFGPYGWVTAKLHNVSPIDFKPCTSALIHATCDLGLLTRMAISLSQHAMTFQVRSMVENFNYNSDRRNTHAN